MKLAKYKLLNPKAGKAAKESPAKVQLNVYIRAEKDLIESARNFARKNNMSLSALVENYFRVIHENAGYETALEMPASSSLKGILKGARLDKSHYLRYLQDKYK